MIPMDSNSNYIDVTSPDETNDQDPPTYNSHSMEDEGGDMGDDEKHHRIELDMKPEDALPEDDPDADADIDADVEAEMDADVDSDAVNSETVPVNSQTETILLPEDNEESPPNNNDVKFDSENVASMSSGQRDGSDQDLSQSQVKSTGNITGGLTRPPQGSEVFIGGIVKETTEDDLKELCSPIGEVFEVRLLKDKETGINKSFAFVTFTCKEHAELAIQTLTDSEVKGKKVRVTHSQSKHRLFVGNVPKTWTMEELKKAMNEEGEGIVAIDLLNDPKTPGRNRGFAFVEYYNHTCAENARRNLSKFNFRLGGNVPTISWAEPRPEPDASALSSVKVIYVKGLSESMTEEKMKEIFSKYGEIDKAIIPSSKEGTVKRDFGFIHYFERSSALKAVEDGEKPNFDGKTLEVSFAKPPSEKRPLPPPESYPPSSRTPTQHHHNNKPTHSSSAGNYSYGSGIRGNYYPPGNVPMIYGRGPPPAGMTMVPMVLPDGRLGYVFQPPGSSPGGGSNGPIRISRDRDRDRERDRDRDRDREYRERGSHGGGGQGGSHGSRGGSQSNTRRYRPY